VSKERLDREKRYKKKGIRIEVFRRGSRERKSENRCTELFQTNVVLKSSLMQRITMYMGVPLLGARNRT
jgi:hypothetical protein